MCTVNWYAGLRLRNPTIEPHRPAAQLDPDLQAVAELPDYNQWPNGTSICLYTVAVHDMILHWNWCRNG